MKKLILITVFGIVTTNLYADETATLYSFKSLSIELASKAARVAMIECRKQGYSVAVAVVDRGGILQAFYRDRFAGPHTVDTAFKKAWTANSFRQSTGKLADLLNQGVIPNQVQHNPGSLLVAGGELIQSAGIIIGAIGVSGAPPGKSELDSIDGRCGQEGINSIKDELDFSD